MSHPSDPIDPRDAAELRRSLATAPDADEHAAHVTPAEMSRDDALLRLADNLPDDAFASIHLAEVALANKDVAADLRASKPARFFREWSVLITAPGYSHNHAGDQLGPVVEQALTDYLDWRAARDAEEWARTAIPDAAPPKPPKLRAPGTAETTRQDEQRGKDVG